MMYKDCLEFIDNNEQRVKDAVLKMKPAQEVASFLVAPHNIYTNAKMKKTFFKRCVDDGESNEYVLMDEYPELFVSDQLRPFIVLRHSRDFTLLDMGGYLEGLAANEEGKDS